MIAARLLHDVGLQRPLVGATQAEEWARWVVARVHRGLCAMHGHDLLLHFEPRRLALLCVNCGWESAGWTFDRPRLNHGRHQRRA